MPIQFYERAPENNIKLSEILTKPKAISSNMKQPSIFLNDMWKFQERGQITNIDSNFSNFLTKDIIPHGNIPWNLYKESYKRVPLVYNAINNTADFAMQGGWELEASSFAREQIEKWFDKVNFELILRNILIQMQIYGNAYLDISDIDFPKLLPPETMFVKVIKGGDRDGEITGYIQRNGIDPKQDVNFTIEELIHFKWNDAISIFYGLSEIHPALGAITRYENLMLDLGAITHNFAAPINHWKLGSDEIPATQVQIDDFKALLDSRNVGEDIVTSTAVENIVIGAGQSIMQLDGLIKIMQDDIISALRIPATFARGGSSSNKATAQVELEAFDRKVRALQQATADLLEDFLFPKISKGEIKIKWNDLAAEGELIRAQRLNSYVLSGIPVEIALSMAGLGTWVDDVTKAREKQKEELLAQQQIQGTEQSSQLDAKNSKKTVKTKQEEIDKSKFRNLKENEDIK